MRTCDDPDPDDDRDDDFLSDLGRILVDAVEG